MADPVGAITAGTALYGAGRQIFSDIKGGSPREQAFAGHSRQISDLVSRQVGMGERRHEAIQPMLENIRNLLGQQMGVQSAAVSGNIGDALSRGGVARGHDRGGAFTGAQAPVTAQYLAQLGNVEGMNIDALLSLLSQEDQTIAQLLGLQTGALGGIKGTTTTGDALAVLQTLGNVGAGVFGQEGIFPGGEGFKLPNLTRLLRGTDEED